MRGSFDPTAIRPSPLASERQYPIRCHVKELRPREVNVEESCANLLPTTT